MANSSHDRAPSNSVATEIDNPQNMVVTSLRSQVSDLVSQVTQLNGKLVQSYDRISDLEDNMHIVSSNLRNSTLKIAQLELERTQHLSALNTGLLVEKSHVTAELTRLMERATDEAARRGKAESARQEIEKDLDDLSAELFDRANTMVAEARLARAKSERRVQDAETMLKGAEEAVASMQAQMQILRDEKDRTDRTLDKGKWIERERPSVSSIPLNLLSTHVPYQEFLLFIAHLRQIRPATPICPPIATLLSLPFLSRLVSEDSDPTLRLDMAPSLNWLTRRSVTSAIHQCQLTIEPLSIPALLEVFTPSHSISQPESSITIPCALCGKSVLPNAYSSPSYSHASTNGVSISWRPNFFSKPSSGSTQMKQSSPAIHSPSPSVATSTSFYPASSTSTRLSPPPTPPLHSPPLNRVYIFRLHPTSSQSSQAPTASTYPLCTSGWCLARLRTTCELWRFIGSSIIDKIWDEELPNVGLGSQHSLIQHTSMVHNTNGKPPVPPRRRLPSSMNVGVGKLLGLASSALKGSSTSTKQNSDGRDVRRSLNAAPAKVVGPPPLPRRSDVRGGRVEEVKKKHTTERIEITDMAIMPKHTQDTGKPTGSQLSAPTDTNVSKSSAMYQVDDPRTPRKDSFEYNHVVSKIDTGTICSVQASTIQPTQVPLPDSPVSSNSPIQWDPPHEGVGTQKPEPKVVKTPTEAIPATNAASSPSIEAPPDATALDDNKESASHANRPMPEAVVEPASPAPPPLPRRAPRRAAPVPGDGSRNSILGADSNAAESLRPTEDGHRKSFEAGDSPVTVKPIVDCDNNEIAVSKSTAGTTPVHEEGLVVETTQRHADHPDNSDVSAVSEKQKDNQPNMFSHSSLSTHSSQSLEPSSRREPAPSLRDSDDRQLSSIFSERQESSPRRASISTTAANNTHSSGEHEAYIGDATWEERTWKVLVKFREDMFYARLGSVRQSAGC